MSLKIVYPICSDISVLIVAVPVGIRHTSRIYYRYISQQTQFENRFNVLLHIDIIAFCKIFFIHLFTSIFIKAFSGEKGNDSPPNRAF